MATQVSTAPAEIPSITPKPAARLESLDAFRGFIMFWIVGGSALIQRFGGAFAYELHHTEWQGLRFYDLIWPSFMLMTGMSLPFSYAKRSLTQTHAEIGLRVLRRAAVLFLLGSLRESVHLNHPYWVELSSALQPIAIAYAAAFLLVRCSALVQASVAAGILFGHALLLAPFGYAKGVNLVLTVDLAVLGRAHPEGWGTVLSTIPTISTTILGMLLGKLLMSAAPAARKLRIVAGAGAALVALGWLLNPVIPIVMKLWTTSYGLASAGWACLMFALFYWIIDVRGYRGWAFPFAVIGMNAVAVYMAASLVPLRRIVGIFAGGVTGALVFLIIEWLILYWMYRRKVFLTA